MPDPDDFMLEDDHPEVVAWLGSTETKPYLDSSADH